LRAAGGQHAARHFVAGGLGLAPLDQAAGHVAVDLGKLVAIDGKLGIARKPCRSARADDRPQQRGKCRRRHDGECDPEEHYR
jgi:hypothetical protein